jgi:uncharacterized protein YukE
MKQLIEFPVENGESIWIEVEEPKPKGGEIEVSRRDLTKKANKTFQDAMQIVKPVSDAIINKISQLNDNIKEIEVEFGMKMDVKAGAIIASTGVEANFKMKLKWKRD